MRKLNSLLTFFYPFSCRFRLHCLYFSKRLGNFSFSFPELVSLLTIDQEGRDVFNRKYSNKNEWKKNKCKLTK